MIFLIICAGLAELFDGIVGWFSANHPTLGTVIGVPLLGAAIGLVLGG
ncbi:MAG: hypothetical protein ACO3RX_01585 [Chthoniobacterales bacterium]